MPRELFVPATFLDPGGSLPSPPLDEVHLLNSSLSGQRGFLLILVPPVLPLVCLTERQCLLSTWILQHTSKNHIKASGLYTQDVNFFCAPAGCSLLKHHPSKSVPKTLICDNWFTSHFTYICILFIFTCMFVKIIMNTVLGFIDF